MCYEIEAGGLYSLVDVSDDTTSSYLEETNVWQMPIEITTLFMSLQMEEGGLRWMTTWFGK